MEVRELTRQLPQRVDRMSAIALTLQSAQQRHAQLKTELLALYQRSVAVHHPDISPATVAALLSMNTELKAQGRAVRLDKRTAA